MLIKHSDDAELCTLLVDLLNFGTQSQIYTDYNTENLANAKLTDAQKQLGTLENRVLRTVQKLDYSTIENATAKFVGAGLVLNEATTVRFTIKADDINGTFVKVIIGETTIIVPCEKFVLREDGKGYYVYVNGLTATQMSDEIFATVCKGDDAVSNTIRYSVESYAYSKVGGSDDNLSELLISMIKYGDSAKAYLQKQ